MQTLRVVGRLFPEVLSGEKTATIRFREARIVPGPLRHVHAGDPARTAVVRVLRCTDLALRAVAGHLGRARDWPDDVLLAGMREHYPAITLDDVVQVIEHAPHDPTHPV